MSAAILGTALGLGKTIFGGIGGTGSDKCRGRQSQIKRKLAQLPASKLQYLKRISGSPDVSSDPDRLAYHYVGGHDCDTSTHAPPELPRFRAEVERLIKQAEQPASRPAGQPASQSVAAFPSSVRSWVKWAVGAAMFLIIGYMVTQGQ